MDVVQKRRKYKAVLRLLETKNVEITKEEIFEKSRTARTVI